MESAANPAWTWFDWLLVVGFCAGVVYCLMSVIATRRKHDDRAAQYGGKGRGKGTRSASTKASRPSWSRWETVLGFIWALLNVVAYVFTARQFGRLPWEGMIRRNTAPARPRIEIAPCSAPDPQRRHPQSGIPLPCGRPAHWVHGGHMLCDWHKQVVENYNEGQGRKRGDGISPMRPMMVDGRVKAQPGAGKGMRDVEREARIAKEAAAMAGPKPPARARRKPVEASPPADRPVV